MTTRTIRPGTLRTTTCEHCDCSFDFDAAEHIVFDDGCDFPGDYVEAPAACDDCARPCWGCGKHVGADPVQIGGVLFCASCDEIDSRPNMPLLGEMQVWCGDYSEAC